IWLSRLLGGGRLGLGTWLPPSSLLNQILLVGGLGIAGGGVYAAGIWALRVEEVGLLLDAVRERLQRGA
ncbi:MAG: hypothetical protein D6796_12150, partial [Caldilineae bacterium]